MSTTSVPYRPLGIIASCLESLGFQITHSYDDLIFMEHNAFLLQMGEKGEDVRIFFNVDCEDDKRQEIATELTERGKSYNLVISNVGRYQLTPNEKDDTLQLQFFTDNP